MRLVLPSNVIHFVGHESAGLISCEAEQVSRSYLIHTGHTSQFSLLGTDEAADASFDTVC